MVSTLSFVLGQETEESQCLGGCAVPAGEGVREVARAIRVTLCSPVARRQPVGTPYSLQGPVFTGAGLVEGPNIDLWGTVSPASRVLP